MTKILFSSLVVLTVSLGCNKTEEPQPKADTAEPPEESPVAEEDSKLPPPPNLAPENPTTQLGPYPVPGDLEAEADKSIVIDNLEAELDRLEAEIGG